MKTIDQLIKEHEEKTGKPFVQDGSFIVTNKDWDSSTYFTPYFFDWNGRVWGKLDYGAEASYSGDINGWQLYAPPKPKVKMWQWLLKSSDGAYFIPTNFFKSKEDVIESYAFSVAIKPLDYTEIEVEE